MSIISSETVNVRSVRWKNYEEMNKEMMEVYTLIITFPYDDDDDDDVLWSRTVEVKEDLTLDELHKYIKKQQNLMTTIYMSFMREEILETGPMRFPRKQGLMRFTH